MKPKGFTLLELLVVVAIIAVLAAMLLPAFNKAKQTAQGIQCISNQRQLWTAWKMYADDNQDRLLYAQQEFGWVPGTQSYAWLPSYDDNYVQFKSAPNRWNADVTVKKSLMWPYCSKNLGIWKCPAIHLMVSTNGWGSGGPQFPVVWGQAVNWFMGGGNDAQPVYTKVSAIPSPAELFVFTDLREDWGVWSTSVSIGGIGGFAELPAFAHNRSASYTFADGHSEAHRWLDPRTTAVPLPADAAISPGNVDATWIFQHAHKTPIPN